MWPCNTCFFRKEWEQKSFFKAKKVTWSMNNEYDRMLFYRYIGETLNQSALVHEANLLFKGVFHEELWYYAGGGGGQGRGETKVLQTS